MGFDLLAGRIRASMEAVQFTTSDGHVLDGDLAVPDGPRSAVVLCHPHPQYGGSRHDHVISRLFDDLPRHGHAALRFDFRRVDGGARSTSGSTPRRRSSCWPRYGSRARVPLHLCGYSFGAIVALGVHDPRLASHVLVAPPLGAGFPEDPPDHGAMLIVAEHDQFCPPDAVDGRRGRLARRPPRSRTVAMADHFFTGRAGAVAADSSPGSPEPSA
jgi:uncharacterized protein